MDNVNSDNNATEKEDVAARVRMELYDWLQCIVTAIICGVLIFIFIGRTIGVVGSSMLQTLQHRDRVIISNLFYTPNNGDVVVFIAPSERFEHPLVKRVIATEGQTIYIDSESGEVFVNDVLVNEPYINTTTAGHNFDEPMMIPRGYVFVMGDNRNSSTDSRDSSVGFVDTRYILGKVMFVLIPGADDNGQRDWNRVGPV
ncbi:MAG: signal peptidase I [Oscillospiraceae bacterium]|nr:signal peptidase I [Oscillospiraceae bacterium]